MEDYPRPPTDVNHHSYFCLMNYKMTIGEKIYSAGLYYPDVSGCTYCTDLLHTLNKYSEKTIVKRSNKADVSTEYAFTLTMPPTYKPIKPIDEVARLICTNGLTNKPYEKSIKWAYVLEHTEGGTPHIHGVYKTLSGRRIAAKYFKRYWDLWDEDTKLGNGHKGGYHQKARHTESYEAYMIKEGCVQSSEKISNEKV